MPRPIRLQQQCLRLLTAAATTISTSASTTISTAVDAIEALHERWAKETDLLETRHADALAIAQGVAAAQPERSFELYADQLRREREREQRERGQQSDAAAMRRDAVEEETESESEEDGAAQTPAVEEIGGEESED